jgi:hypothetical protein
MALSGATGAMGADFTSTITNPAGIGLYKTSEATLTPAIFSQNIKSEYNGGTGQDTRSSFYLGNLGLVITWPMLYKTKPTKWKYFQFATGLNRLKDFNSKSVINGPNAKNSFLDTYVEYAEGPPQIPYTNIEQGFNNSYAFNLNLAWWTYLLDIKGNEDSYNYINPSPVPDQEILQSKTTGTKGSMNEYVFTAGANYNERFYMGVTLGIPYLKYIENTTYSEEDISPPGETGADTVFDARLFKRTEQLETRGTGFNLHLGMIYRITDWLRVGAAMKTPTWYGMKDKWTANMESYFYDGDYYYEESVEGEYKYKLTTPLKATIGATALFGNNGLFSVDYEFENYRQSKFSANDYDFEQTNSNINESYKNTHHLRLGTEWRKENWSFRGGLYWADSPYKEKVNNAERWSASIGSGYRTDKFFIDFTYVFSYSQSDYYLYLTENVQPNPANNTFMTHQVLVTTGLRF